jgi:integrase
MKGHLRPRGPGSFELKLDIGRDAAGKRITEYRTIKGGRRQAETALAKLVAAVDKGDHVARRSTTVAEHVSERIERWTAVGRIGAKVRERYAGLLKNQIVPFIGQIPLQALKASDVEKWHGQLCVSGRTGGRGGLSPRTVRHAHRLLSTALKEAARHDLVIRNVASMQSPPRAPRTEVSILTAEQIPGLIRDLKERSIFPKVVLALFAGLRVGEVLALRWQDFDLDRKMVTVRAALEETISGGIVFKTPKTRAGGREISLPDIVVETMRALRRQQLEQRLALGMGKLTGDALVFARLDGSPQSPHRLSKEWGIVAGSIGLGEATFHSLRHAHASMLIASGVDVVKISKRLGHASPTMTLGTYAHLFAQREDQAADAINAAVAGVLGP